MSLFKGSINMPLFKVSKKFPFKTPLLKQYFMCFKVWKEAMPYKSVEITPEHKFRWNWRVADSINFGLFKWDSKHNFTSVQEEHEDFLSIQFENSNQVTDFHALILFKEMMDAPLETTVSLQVDKLNMKDPLLQAAKVVFLEVVKEDYRKFLDNVYKILQDAERRLQVLGDCYWTDYKAIDFAKTV
ncbi:MAG: hypothetical protein LUQ65_00085 [Candidatus Helarchaeota archaeon]|nr:hypothetical protein [Candidatus Helarchaeota archaeon]